MNHLVVEGSGSMRKDGLCTTCLVYHRNIVLKNDLLAI